MQLVIATGWMNPWCCERCERCACTGCTEAVCLLSIAQERLRCAVNVLTIISCIYCFTTFTRDSCVQLVSYSSTSLLILFLPTQTE